MSQNVLQKIIRILQKEPKERNNADKKMLKELTKDIAFFQQYQENDYVHDNCCSYMNYESYDEEQTVFEINQTGDKFYIILEGTVGVYIYNESKEMICVKQLGKGFSFGELALLYESPRMATIICLEKCHFAVLNKKEFLRVLKNFQKENLNKKLLYLQNLPLFQKINLSLLRQIYSKAFDIRTAKGQIIFKQGSAAENFYIVKQGEFQVKQEISHMVDQEEVHSIQSLQNQDLTKITNKKQKYLTVQISLLIQGDYFGEEDLLKNNEKRSFSVECATASGEIIMIQKNLFLQILEESHSNIFLREHLAIKESQHKVRIQNAKKQIQKFKQFLTEDRDLLKVTKQIQEEQISFQKSNRIIKSQKEININHDYTLMDKNQKDTNQFSNKQRRSKKSITHFIVNEEQQQQINDKIQRLVEQRANQYGRKPKVPTQKDINNQRQSPITYQSSKFQSQTEQSPTQNEQSSQNISSQTVTPFDSPSITPTQARKNQLIKILSQKIPYKQSLFSENLIFADRSVNPFEFSANLQQIDENQNKMLETQQEAKQDQLNRSTMMNKKSFSTKNISEQKAQLQNKSVQQLNSYLNNKIRNISEYQNEKTGLNAENSYQSDLNSLPESPKKFSVHIKQSQQALLQIKQQQQNISSSNNPERITTHQQIKSMFEDNSKFVSNFFNKTQVKKLTTSLQKYQDDSLNQERINIKRSILKKKSKNSNYIDYSSDDLKRNLIDQINILTSPRQKQSSIIFHSSLEKNKPQKQISQPTLKFIEFQKLEVPELSVKQNKNGSLTDIQRKAKYYTEINTNPQSYLFNTNNNKNNNKLTQLKSSINFKLEEDQTKLMTLTCNRSNNQANSFYYSQQNSCKNLFQNTNTNQLFSTNIHIRKDQSEQNKQKPLKMSIRFQNLFKNHQQNQ
ncbi:cyclic nucleotide-binding domain protein (macronuclear) [Tetrahymena thermophila SB210]|uniref:Cyclic nucleotide-binding domain protein n=1 Tax=Tetrahymena thermophila (strain SB210) TaxID=312017 RepID=Q23YQ2_TETTS|nr:cyclic nucleotide-binding domain protein [Tetrahymena thermophila SB210]EAS01670.2 cyclic nucleotide-binding domain protein [Tetrahymena thermophila SB210]|eukprot:XP_001021915.2 cyclic nucleotide-binding domain protein [Tetrahymena thermophila SB210]